MQVTITSVAGKPYQHELKARQHTILTDAEAALKGGDTAPTPHELLLFALGGCTAMTVEMYAARKGMSLTKVTVTVSESTIDNPDGSGTKVPHIVEEIALEGNLTDAERDALKAIAERCPVYKLVTGPKVVEAKLSRAANSP